MNRLLIESVCAGENAAETNRTNSFFIYLSYLPIIFLYLLFLYLLIARLLLNILQLNKLLFGDNAKNSRAEYRLFSRYDVGAGRSKVEKGSPCKCGSRH